MTAETPEDVLGLYANTMQFYIRCLSTHKFRCPYRSWNQSLQIPRVGANSNPLLCLKTVIGLGVRCTPLVLALWRQSRLIPGQPGLHSQASQGYSETLSISQNKTKNQRNKQAKKKKKNQVDMAIV